MDTSIFFCIYNILVYLFVYYSFIYLSVLVYTGEYNSQNTKVLSTDFIFGWTMPIKMEQLISLGVLLMLVGFIIIFFGILKGSKETASGTKIAVGGFIGPIPFGFGNDKNFVQFVTFLSISLFLIWLLFSFRNWK